MRAHPAPSSPPRSRRSRAAAAAGGVICLSPQKRATSAAPDDSAAHDFDRETTPRLACDAMRCLPARSLGSPSRRAGTAAAALALPLLLRLMLPLLLVHPSVAEGAGASSCEVKGDTASHRCSHPGPQSPAEPFAESVLLLKFAAAALDPGRRVQGPQ
ncbi:hypothetical protein MNEG_15872, partial [Monoraphidium neglectum]